MGTPLHSLDPFATPPLTSPAKLLRTGRGGSATPTIMSPSTPPLGSPALTGVPAPISDATLALTLPVTNPPIPTPFDPSYVGDVTSSTTSNPSNELHFYVACGRYKHEIKVKDIADQRNADKLYADVKTLITRDEAYEDYEIDSIDVFNQKVIVKCGTDKKEIDLKEKDKDLARNLQNLFDKVLEKALGSDGPACQWPKIYRTAAGPINAGSWFHPNPSEVIKKLKKISATDFAELKMRSNPSMAKERKQEIFEQMNTAEELIKKLKEDTDAKLLEQKAEKDRLEHQPGFDENDQAYKDLEASIIALERFDEELNNLDMFALFSILYSNHLVGSDADKITSTNEHVEDILKGFGGSRRLIPDSHKMYAKQVAVAAQMTNRIDCSMLCREQQIEPKSDPLEWVIAQYLLRDCNLDNFFAHPHIANLIGKGTLAANVLRSSPTLNSAVAPVPSSTATI